MGSPPPSKRPKAVPSPSDSTGREATSKRDIERDAAAGRPTEDGDHASDGALEGATRPYPRASTKTPVTRSPAIKPPKSPPPPPPPRRVPPPPPIAAPTRRGGPAAPTLTGDAATSGAARPIVDDWDFDPIEDAPTLARNSSNAVAELQAEADALAAAQANAADSKASGDESRATASAAGVLGGPAASSIGTDTAPTDEAAANKTTDAPATEHAAPPEADEADEADEAPPEAPPAPRLPMPGMLRDGSPPPRTDFRAPPRTPLPTVAASAPPPGVAPPKKVDSDNSDRHLRPGDTGAFIAVVANELMAELANDEPAAGESVELEAIADTSDAAAAASASAVAVVPSAQDTSEAAPPPADPPTRRRAFPWIPATIAVVLLLGLLVWLMGDDPPEDTATPVANVARPPAPTADGVPIAAAADDGSTGGPTTTSPGGSTDEVSTGTTTRVGTGTGTSNDSGSGSSSGSDSGTTGGSETGGSETGEDSSDGGLVIEDETDTGEPAPSPVATSHSKPKHKPSGNPSKPTSRKPSKGKSKPASAPPPKSTEDPAELLKRARIAYRTGKGAGAYRLASRARKLQPSTAAAELMALASCLMKKPDQARTALKAVPLLRRSSIRSECRSKHGVRVGV